MVYENRKKEHEKRRYGELVGETVVVRLHSNRNKYSAGHRFTTHGVETTFQGTLISWNYLNLLAVMESQ